MASSVLKWASTKYYRNLKEGDSWAWGSAELPERGDDVGKTP